MAGEPIYVSAHSLVELVYAVENHVAKVPRTPNADPADRIIVATAEVLGIPVVSSDRHLPGMTQNPVIW